MRGQELLEWLDDEETRDMAEETDAGTAKDGCGHPGHRAEKHRDQRSAKAGSRCLPYPIIALLN